EPESERSAESAARWTAQHNDDGWRHGRARAGWRWTGWWRRPWWFWWTRRRRWWFRWSRWWWHWPLQSDVLAELPKHSEPRELCQSRRQPRIAAVWSVDVDERWLRWVWSRQSCLSASHRRVASV